ncbi:hypothetical protein [Aquisalimonas asiatica]|uniref:hypothetical protein n=1 Tax=Aquisalimonas asiatica TaxID=406100 RepID=UPI0011141C8D|nr:hypothetical protein [Aquisalimonas asiatica]
MSDDALVLAVCRLGTGSAETTMSLYQQIDRLLANEGYRSIDLEDVLRLGLAVMLRAVPDGDVNSPFSALFCAGFSDRLDLDKDHIHREINETFQEYSGCINLRDDLNFASCCVNLWGLTQGYPSGFRRSLIMLLRTPVAGLAHNNRDYMKKIIREF